ncbi:methyl-accepting chemotaxis protein [Brevibacillus sp. LEMMJ03]|uniref:methyl-accepting chemotaxis protein n=1 Tax=Brevibacillus sp. LEMMJ03 TaxID=2595056 RepID=UPI00117ECCC2|nr:methyl-accepting chemotaxis protein [Brevibacillus sp. LEMMJ03]TRY27048.1 methyl-accepting chemotaxis protein [Brevibacillus sp. LEMMJ03]
MKLGARVLIALLLTGIVPLTAAGVFAYTETKRELLEGSAATLEALRNSNKEQVENYFRERSKNLETLAASGSVAQSLAAFDGVWKLGREAPAYQEAEQTWGKELKMEVSRYGFANAYLLNENGDVVYQTKPQADFGTNLYSGPYSGTPLGQTVKQAAKGLSLELSDVSRYEPSGGVPAVFMAAPIFDHGTVIGQLAAEVSLEYVSRQLNRREGLGDTGKIYLIGADKLMRTELGNGQETMLRQKVETPIAEQALSSGSTAGTAQAVDYRGEEVLVAYDRVQVGKLNWAILAEMDMTEIMAGPNQIRNAIVAFNGIVLVLVAAIAWGAAAGLRRSFAGMLSIAGQIGRGDFTAPFPAKLLKRSDELGELARSLLAMREQLHDILRQVRQAAASVTESVREIHGNTAEIASSSEQITRVVEDVSTSADRQVDKMGHTLHLAEALTASVNSVTSHVEQVTLSSREMKGDAEAGRQAVEAVIASMEEIDRAVTATTQTVHRLEQRSRDISQIIAVITEIARQTNLLALNAGIEAARAGEHGKGFAVVAGEVRKLAEGTNAAAQQIVAMINEIQRSTAAIVEQMDDGTRTVAEGRRTAGQSDEMFRRIEQNIRRVSAEMEGVSQAFARMAPDAQQVVAVAQEVSAASREAAAGVQGISAAVEEQNAAMELIVASADQLAVLAERLSSSLTAFRLDDIKE